MSQTSNPYAILSLPPSSQTVHLTSASIKAAYRRALLRYHPDKSAAGLQAADQSNLKGLYGDAETSKLSSAPSVDDLIAARDILLDPVRRKECDTRLAVESSGAAPVGNAEIVDLDDLEFDSTKNLWRRSCRCGDPVAYLVLEQDLVEAADDGEREVLVSCAGCSLCLRIMFDLA